MVILEQISTTHEMIKKIAGRVPEEKWFVTPAKFKNNIAWNIAHIATTWGLLAYKRSGLKFPLPEACIKNYGKGSSPENWQNLEDTAQDMMGYLNLITTKVVEDYKANAFANFEVYETSAGVILNNIEDAISFLHFHDGLHAGYLLAMMKSLT